MVRLLMGGGAADLHGVDLLHRQLHLLVGGVLHRLQALCSLLGLGHSAALCRSLLCQRSLLTGFRLLLCSFHGLFCFSLSASRERS